MMSVAIKMLIGDKASCIGVIFGIFLATLLISQQSAIFLGLVSRSYRLVTDIPQPDLWIVDPATESDDKVRSLPINYLDVVRGTPDVEWAVPITITNLPLVTPAGVFQVCQLYGVDDATIIGAPQHIVSGNVRDLRRQGAVIVDIYSAQSSLAKTLPDGGRRALQLGDSFEINQRRALVVGLCEITQGFYPQPIIYTTQSNFNYFAPFSTGRIGFIAAKTAPGSDTRAVIQEINSSRILKAFTKEEFKWRIANHFLETGILINFGLSVALGCIIGFSIAGQIFYIMTLQNLVYYALIRSIGASNKTILQMVLLQAFLVGFIGYCLGTGVTVLWGLAIGDTTLAFFFPWQLLLFTGGIILIICLFTAGLSLRKIFTVEPKVLMGS